MSETESEEQVLPCGRDAEREWARARAGVEPDDHEQNCDHCGALFDQQEVLSAATEQYGSTSPVPNVALAERVMRAVRLERRPAVRLRMPGPVPSLVTDSAVVAVVRAALDADPSVLLRRCVVEPEDGDEDGRDPSAPVPLRVGLGIEVSFERFTSRAARPVEHRVAEVVRDVFALAVDIVDIEIVDVFSEPSDPDAGSAGPG